MMKMRKILMRDHGQQIYMQLMGSMFVSAIATVAASKDVARLATNTLCLHHQLIMCVHKRTDPWTQG